MARPIRLADLSLNSLATFQTFLMMIVYVPLSGVTKLRWTTTPNFSRTLFLIPRDSHSILHSYAEQIANKIMKITIIGPLSGLVGLTSAHSWLHCTSHNNTIILQQMKDAAVQYGKSHIIDLLIPWFVQYFNSWPRAKYNPGDWVDETKNYLWNLPQAQQQGENHACNPQLRAPNHFLTAPISGMEYHKDPATMATAIPGGAIKLMFGGNGHSRGANAGGNGDPGKVSVYWTGAPETEIVTVDDLNLDNLLQENDFSEESFAFSADINVQSPEQGLVDEGNWQTILLPDGMEKGRHMMVWVWSFGGMNRFSTCFDVMIE